MNAAMREFAERRWTRIPLALSRADLEWLDSWLDAGVSHEPEQSRVIAEVKAALAASKPQRVFP